MSISFTRLVPVALFTLSAVSAGFQAPASPASVNVNAGIAGSGSQNIGTMVVDDHADDAGNFMTATFELNDTYAYLDEWYNFRWINVVTGYTTGGATEDYDGDGNDDMPQFDFALPSPPFMELPAIDPQPGPFMGGQFYNDDAPYYFTDTEHEDDAAAGEAAPYSDSRGTHPAGVVISFTTYLCAESETDTSITGTTVCILASFSWTSTGTGGGANPPGNDEALVSTDNSPDAADATSVNTAMANASQDHADNMTSDDGDFMGWTASSSCSLSECPQVTDCVFTDIAGTTFSESSWTDNGTEIGKTFEGGVTPIPGVPQYDTSYLPTEPNDWHWSVSFPWNDLQVNVTCWVDNFAAGDTIEIEVVCSPQFQDTMLQIDLGANQYVLMDLAVPIHQGLWSDYPFDLPPSLGFTPAGLGRANFRAGPEFSSGCFGDGGDQLGCTDCACLNNAPIGSGGGCQHSQSALFGGAGAQLVPGGSASLSAQDLCFEMINALPNSFAVLVSAPQVAPDPNGVQPCAIQNPGSGVPSIAFDGLRCVISGGLGPVRRHASRAIDALGQVSANGTPPEGVWGFCSPNFPNSNFFLVGETRHFQAIYREIPGLGCRTEQNTSQRVSMTFSP